MAAEVQRDTLRSQTKFRAAAVALETAQVSFPDTQIYSEPLAAVWA
jgi:hypothetical protein